MKLDPSAEDQFLPLRTPCLLLDADRVEQNIADMASHACSLGIPLRVHLKTSKTAAVTDMLRKEGVTRFAVSTMSEAVAASKSGARDILYTTPLTPEKVPELQRLNRAGAKLCGLIEDMVMARALSEAAAAVGDALPVMVEADFDGVRGGVPFPGAAFTELAEYLADDAAFQLLGAMSYSGLTYGASDMVERTSIAEHHDKALSALGQELVGLGVARPILSTGGSPGVLAAREARGANEFRPGVFVFWDMAQVLRGVCKQEHLAVGVLVTVLSVRPEKGTALIDAGAIALSLDKAGGADGWGHGRVIGLDGESLGDLCVAKCSQEHGVVQSRNGDPAEIGHLRPGQRLVILPAHVCLTAAQHDEYHVLRDGTPTGENWPRFRGW